jgi:hypothetical protein
METPYFGHIFLIKRTPNTTPNRRLGGPTFNLDAFTMREISAFAWN